MNFLDNVLWNLGLNWVFIGFNIDFDFYFSFYFYGCFSSTNSLEISDTLLLDIDFGREDYEL